MNKYMIGLKKNEIPTPALLIDLDKVDYNISKMANFCQTKKINLRPHIKTHKTPFLAHKQIEAGAIGITCQKLSEAEVMVEAGIKDILISNEVVGEQKIKRLVALSKHADVKVCVDNDQNIMDISRMAKEMGTTVGVLVEVDVGMNRCGVPPREPVLHLAQKIIKQENLKFLGLMGYEGHAVLIKSYQERKAKTEEAMELLIGTANLLRSKGIECKIISAGGTSTYNITGCYPGVTEIQPGSYITMDLTYENIEGIGGEFKQAVSVLATVISKPTKERAVLDAGIKAISVDMGTPKVFSPKGIQVDHLHEEHTLVKIEDPEKKELNVGDKVELIPTHGCTTFNLYNFFYGLRDDKVELVVDIKARGKSE